jgi:hypothetical protein
MVIRWGVNDFGVAIDHGDFNGILVLPSYEHRNCSSSIINAVPLWSGCCLGGEWGGAVLAIENAPPNKRAWYGMFPQLGAQ